MDGICERGIDQWQSEDLMCMASASGGLLDHRTYESAFRGRPNDLINCIMMVDSINGVVNCSLRLILRLQRVRHECKLDLSFSLCIGI